MNKTTVAIIIVGGVAAVAAAAILSPKLKDVQVRIEVFGDMGPEPGMTVKLADMTSVSDANGIAVFNVPQPTGAVEYMGSIPAQGRFVEMTGSVMVYPDSTVVEAQWTLALSGE